MTLLIDGDMCLYKACAAVEREVRWDEDNHVLFSHASEAAEAFDRIIYGYQEALGDAEVAVAFSGNRNFRHGLVGDYKAGRSRKPLCYARVLEECTWPWWRVDCLEGDDLLGIWATQGKLTNPVIISDDKDMKTIPGKLYRMGELETISEQAADYWWMYQTLTGDPTDGYQGIPGIGPKKAEAILHEALDGYGSMGIGKTIGYMWPAVVAAYEKAGLTVDDALTQARLSRILRASDWDSAKQEVILWEP